MLLSVMWQILSSVEQRGCVDKDFGSWCNEKWVPTKSQEKCFQLTSIFLFCVRESSSTSFFSWIFGILFCFFVLGIKPKALQMAKHAYTQSVTYASSSVHIFHVAWLTLPLNNMCCHVTWTLGLLRVWTTSQRVYTAEPRPPCTYVVDVQLGLHVGSEHLERGLSQKLWPVYGTCSVVGLLCLASVGEDAPSLTETWCARAEDTQGNSHPTQKGKGEGLSK